KSNKFGGLKQHNPFSWEISNCDFNYLEKISSSAQYTNDTLNKWLSEVDDNKRKILINTLFDILNSTSSKSFIELSQNRKKNIPIIISAIKNMDAELKSMFIELIKELSSLYLKNLAPHEKSNMSDFKKSFISHLSSK
ncbi:MAG: Mbeg1-like protein, partial [Clostridium celatum]|nr:Mbeg1-like protein [Clostridium celatum]